MISTNIALKHLLKLSEVKNTEVVPLEECSNRVLANNLIASHNQPPFDCSAMDGYALNIDDKITGYVLRIIGESAAGKNYAGMVKSGETVRIFTGAPMPLGTNCVVIQEDIIQKNKNIILKETVEKSHFVRTKGLDFLQGYTVRAPLLIKPSMVSLIAAMNFDKVEVYQKPKIAILATGSELVPPGKKVPPNKIVSSNTYGLAAMLESFGATPHIFPIAKDSIKDISQAIESANKFDLTLTIGGASVGDYDLVIKSVEVHKIKLAFHGVAMKPGKPLFAGTINERLIIGLPGNPVSALVCCQIMVKPVIQKMLGLRVTFPSLKIFAQLGTALSANGKREHYLRAALRQESGLNIVDPIQNQDSSLLTQLRNSNSLIKRVPFAPEAAAGEIVEVLPFFTEFS